MKKEYCYDDSKFIKQLYLETIKTHLVPIEVDFGAEVEDDTKIS